MKKLLTTILLISLIACSDAVINSEKVEDVDFSKLHKYAWLPSPASDSIRYLRFNRSISTSGLKETVNSEMKKRGFVIDNINPDFFVQVNTRFREKTDTINETNTGIVKVQPQSSYYLYNPTNTTNVDAEYYNGYSTITYVDNLKLVNYTEGTIFIDIIKKEDDKNILVWTGWAERALDNDEIRKDLLKDIHEIFEDEFPVKPIK